jgi:hypothetical protein
MRRRFGFRIRGVAFREAGRDDEAVASRYMVSYSRSRGAPRLDLEDRRDGAVARVEGEVIAEIEYAAVAKAAQLGGDVASAEEDARCLAEGGSAGAGAGEGPEEAAGKGHRDEEEVGGAPSFAHSAARRGPYAEIQERRGVEGRAYIREGRRARGDALPVADRREGGIESVGDEVAQVLEHRGREAASLARAILPPRASRIGLGAHAARQLDRLGEAMREGRVAAGEEGDEASIHSR